MKKIAIITARGGSKRIPRKNIKNFCGQPIIAYSIKAALESKIFDEVMVSTDDQEIAEISRQYGAKVPFMRSAENSNDFAGTGDVIVEVLEEYKKRGQEFEYACCIYPTAPFVTPEKLQEAMELMEEHDPIEVLPIVAFSFPPQRCFIINEDKRVEYKYKDLAEYRSQDLEKLYHDAGQFYVYNVEKFLEAKGLVKSGMMPIIVGEEEVQDIDNESDWVIAEMKYKAMRGRK